MIQSNLVQAAPSAVPNFSWSYANISACIRTKIQAFVKSIFALLKEVYSKANDYFYQNPSSIASTRVNSITIFSPDSKEAFAIKTFIKLKSKALFSSGPMIGYQFLEAKKTVLALDPFATLAYIKQATFLGAMIQGSNKDWGDLAQGISDALLLQKREDRTQKAADLTELLIIDKQKRAKSLIEIRDFLMQGNGKGLLDYAIESY